MKLPKGGGNKHMSLIRDNNYRINHSIQIISDTYGDTVSVDQKKKDLRKWGTNESVGTSLTTIMTLPAGETEETFVSANSITHVVSSSGSDTQNLDFYEGHTISAGDLTFLRDETATTLTGQTGVALNTAAARINRAKLVSPAVGTVYFYEGGTTTGGVPDDLTTVHLIIPPGEIQTQKCSTAISSIDYWIISGASVSVLEKTSSWAQFRIEIKPVGETYFYPITEWVSATDSSGAVELIGPGDPYLIVPKNHDVRISAIANTSGIYCSAGLVGYLAKVL